MASERSYLTEHKIEFIFDKNVHLFPELLLNLFFRLATQVGGSLTHPSQCERTSLRRHLLRQITRSCVNVLALKSAEKV